MKNLNDVINNLIEVNDKLSNGNISIEKAKQISQNTQVIINAAKVILDYAKFSGEKKQDFFNLESKKETLIIPERKPYKER